MELCGLFSSFDTPLRCSRISSGICRDTYKFVLWMHFRYLNSRYKFIHLFSSKYMKVTCARW